MTTTDENQADLSGSDHQPLASISDEDDIRRRKARESIYVEGASLFTPDGGVNEAAIRQLVDAVHRKWLSNDEGPLGASDLAPTGDHPAE